MTSVPSETIFSEDPWLQRYRAEYERLPTLSSLPEADREAEYERREAIRKKLLSLPEAPVRDLRSDREKKIDDNRAALIADWILQRWNAEDLDAFHSWWLLDNFASDRLPQFLDADLNRRARNMVLLSSADGEPLPQKSESRPSVPLAEVIEGVVKAGMANVLNEVAKTPAVKRCDAAMKEHLKDRRNADLTLSEWQKMLRQARKTILKTDAWIKVIPQMKRENCSLQLAKAEPILEKVSAETEE